MIINQLEKYDIEEPIQVGDLISYFPQSKKVTRSIIRHWRDNEHNKVVGVCTDVKDNMITYTNSGLVDVNVKGIICIGDHLTASDEFGIAKAIKYEQDESKFRIRHLGKVVGLYNNYNKARVLLDIE